MTDEHHDAAEGEPAVDEHAPGGRVGDVVVTWPAFDPDDPATGRRLVDAGLRVRLAPRTGPRPAERVAEIVGDAFGVIASTDPFDATVFERCRHLRVIARTGVGVDTIDLDAASAAGVVVTTTPGANEETVADHTLALMLALVRRVPEHDASVRAGRWERAGALTPGDLYGATVGLVGWGVIGRAVARRVRAFGSRLLIADPAITSAEGAEVVDLESLLRQSDVVSVHVPLLPGTRGLIGAEQLAMMKPGAVLVNASRGGIVDEPALVAALRDGPLAAAGLDVFEHEPPGGHPLLELPNVVLSPHVGGLSTRAIAELTRRATDSVLAVHAGRIPEDAVNADLLLGGSGR